MAIDPNAVTDFNRTDAQLEEFFIYAVCVAGKQASVISRQVEDLLAALHRERPAEAENHKPLTPFVLLNFHDQDGIARRLQAQGIGCYNQKAAALCKAAGLWVFNELDLRTCTVADLEAIKWIGPKTARFFLLHSRPGQRLAAIDTHILKFLAAKGVKVPQSVPGKGNTYTRLEREFLKLADEAGKSPADYDLMIWKSYATAEA